MFISTYKDVVFIEGIHKEAKQLCRIDEELLGIGAHLRSLRDLKEKMYLKVKASNANCLMDFKYGQKQRILAFDDVAFYGSGMISILPDEIYHQIYKRDEE